jgi:lipopolysaccharide/colanic/teichoic acid biosynthesis glycosyltransferase
MYNKLLKRIFDFTISLIVLILLMPIFIPIIILLLFTGENEVFYFQSRIGLKNQPFKIWKFATMVKNSANMGTGSLTLRNDPRVTPVGRFLRKTKINELPQLINVIIGNMSLVGARPQMKIDFDKFSDEVQDVIYNTNPGITGVGSVVFRDEEKIISSSVLTPHECDKTIISPYKGELEKWYQQHISFKTDILLIVITIYVVIVPNSKLLFELLNELPKIPDNLENKL